MFNESQRSCSNDVTIIPLPPGDRAFCSTGLFYVLTKYCSTIISSLVTSVSLLRHTSRAQLNRVDWTAFVTQARWQLWLGFGLPTFSTALYSHAETIASCQQAFDMSRTSENRESENQQHFNVVKRGSECPWRPLSGCLFLSIYLSLSLYLSLQFLHFEAQSLFIILLTSTLVFSSWGPRGRKGERQEGRLVGVEKEDGVMKSLKGLLFSNDCLLLRWWWWTSNVMKHYSPMMRWSFSLQPLGNSFGESGAKGA